MFDEPTIEIVSHALTTKPLAFLAAIILWMVNGKNRQLLNPATGASAAIVSYHTRFAPLPTITIPAGRSFLTALTFLAAIAIPAETLKASREVMGSEPTIERQTTRAEGSLMLGSTSLQMIDGQKGKMRFATALTDTAIMLDDHLFLPTVFGPVPDLNDFQACEAIPSLWNNGLGPASSTRSGFASLRLKGTGAINTSLAGGLSQGWRLATVTKPSGSEAFLAHQVLADARLAMRSSTLWRPLTTCRT